MLRIVTAIVMLAFASSVLTGQTANTAKRAPAKAVARSKSKAAASKATAKSRGKASVRAATRAPGKSKAKAPARRLVQAQPTPERYKEIQQALANKGYFAGPVDGTWGSDSVEALKRFQKDQNLETDGKLGSMALIALGLGPRRGVAEGPGSSNGDASR